jgi:hypothetical protein
MKIEIEKYFSPEIVARFAEMSQSRSAYQIEKFVINQHDTDEMRYKQCILEAQSLYYTLKKVELENQKTNIEIERLIASGDPIDAIDAEIKILGLEQSAIAAVGAVRELEVLMDWLAAFPKYTMQDIENNQPTYWKRRLYRQHELEVAGKTQSGAAHLQSLYSIGEIQFKLPEELTAAERMELEQ